MKEILAGEQLTDMTMISISVVVFESLIFLDSLDSPLPVLAFLLLLSNFSLFLSASLMARKRNMFRNTRDTHGMRCTNRTRNLQANEQCVGGLKGLRNFSTHEVKVRTLVGQGQGKSLFPLNSFITGLQKAKKTKNYGVERQKESKESRNFQTFRKCSKTMKVGEMHSGAHNTAIFCSLG